MFYGTSLTRALTMEYERAGCIHGYLVYREVWEADVGEVYSLAKESQWHFSKSAHLKVLGHGHVFKVWILISSGNNIIIQIRTRGFGVI